MKRRPPAMLRSAILGAALLCALVDVEPVSAHNTLEDSSPAEGAALTASPPTWTLRFTGTVPLDSASGQIIDGRGVRTTLEDPVHGESQNVIVFALPPDLSGEVTARWRLVGVDGHVISGRVSFGVNSGVFPPATESSPTVDPAGSDESGELIASRSLPEPATYGIRLLDILVLLAILGLILVELRIAQGVTAIGFGTRLTEFGPLVLVATGSLQALAFAAEMENTNLFGSLGAIRPALGTTPGAMAFMQPALAGLVAIQLRKRSWLATKSRTNILLFSASLLLLARAYSGHPRSEGYPLIGIPIDMLHTAAAGIWLGGLAILISSVVPVVNDLSAEQAFRRFGKYARAAVGTILATGFIQTVNLHGGVGAILATSHGRTLLFKLVFVVGMLGFGFANNRRITRRPSVGSVGQNTMRNIIRASLVETALGICVIALTALLVVSSLNDVS